MIYAVSVAVAEKKEAPIEIADNCSASCSRIWKWWEMAIKKQEKRKRKRGYFSNWLNEQPTEGEKERKRKEVNR